MMLLVHLIEQMFSIGANPKFAGAQIVKHCSQLVSIGDSVLFYSALFYSALFCSCLLCNWGLCSFYQTYKLTSRQAPSTEPQPLHWPPFCQNPFSGVTVENLLTEEGSVKRGPSVIITVREWGKNWLGLK